LPLFNPPCEPTLSGSVLIEKAKAGGHTKHGIANPTPPEVYLRLVSCYSDVEPQVNANFAIDPPKTFGSYYHTHVEGSQLIAPPNYQAVQVAVGPAAAPTDDSTAAQQPAGSGDDPTRVNGRAPTDQAESAAAKPPTDASPNASPPLVVKLPGNFDDMTPEGQAEIRESLLREAGIPAEHVADVTFTAGSIIMTLTFKQGAAAEASRQRAAAAIAEGKVEVPFRAEKLSATLLAAPPPSRREQAAGAGDAAAADGDAEVVPARGRPSSRLTPPQVAGIMAAKAERARVHLRNERCELFVLVKEVQGYGSLRAGAALRAKLQVLPWYRAGARVVEFGASGGGAAAAEVLEVVSQQGPTLRVRAVEGGRETTRSVKACRAVDDKSAMAPLASGIRATDPSSGGVAAATAPSTANDPGAGAAPSSPTPGVVSWRQVHMTTCSYPLHGTVSLSS
jgi:hypothetical protein